MPTSHILALKFATHEYKLIDRWLSQEDNKTKFIVFNTLFRFGYSMSSKSIWLIQEEEKWVKPNLCAQGIYNLGGKVRTL